jgi:hypothetical protein
MPRRAGGIGVIAFAIGIVLMVILVSYALGYLAYSLIL